MPHCTRGTINCMIDRVREGLCKSEESKSIRVSPVPENAELTEIWHRPNVPGRTEVSYVPGLRVVKPP